jgi:micrococcal nuclease
MPQRGCAAPGVRSRRWELAYSKDAEPLGESTAAFSGVMRRPRAGRVVGVTDGDTIKVLHANQSEPVRLLGVDAPEKRQAYGDRARRFTAELAFDRTVTVHAAGRDRYGRLLGEVVLPNGRSLNQELVRAGYAWWFRKYSRDIRLARLEEEARQDRRGLWADAAPQAPWEYRISGRR